jgi:tRNA-modifying protein YgfZ
MQTLTLDSKEFDVASTREIGGFTVPWEVKSYVDDFDVAEGTGGFFDLTHWGVVEVKGPDATDYLNRMSTVDFKKFSSDRLSWGAFLTGKAGVISLGLFQKSGDGYHIIVPPGLAAPTVDHIEKFHFSENFSASDQSSEWAIFGLWKPFFDLKQDMEFPSEGTSALKVEWRRWKSTSFEFWQDDRRPNLYWVKIQRKEAGLFSKEMRKLCVPLLGQRLFEYFRVKAGVPTVGVEIGEKDIVLEANFDECVARDKGCYPGQEVVERIFTYGSVNRKLLKVEIDRDEEVDFPKAPAPLHGPGKDAGTLMSCEEDPEDPQRAVGLAYIHKDFWAYDEDFECGEGVVVRITENEASSF